MKLEVTKAQLQAIKNLADDISAMTGGIDVELSNHWNKNVRLVDNMLAKNKLPPRDLASNQL